MSVSESYSLRQPYTLDLEGPERDFGILVISCTSMIGALKSHPLLEIRPSY